MVHHDQDSLPHTYKVDMIFSYLISNHQTSLVCFFWCNGETSLVCLLNDKPKTSEHAEKNYMHAYEATVPNL